MTQPQVPERALAISAVSLLLGIPVPTIRSWERRYAFPTPSRTHGSHRRYGIEEIGQLRALRDEIAAGRSTSDAVVEIRKRRSEESRGPAGWTQSLLDAAMKFDSFRIRSTIQEAAMGIGIDRTIESVLLPVLREIGTRWESGRCDVANEHFASQEIRKWLSNQLSLTGARRKGRSAVLACGPKDMHTIGLEGFYVMLTRRGWNCHYLGEVTPTPALVKTIEVVQPDVVVVASQLGSNRLAAVASIRAAWDKAEGGVFYGGRAFMSARSRRGVPGTYLGEEMVGAVSLIESVFADPAHASGKQTN
jgi:methanogenic corrinoid protein MtbC1/predicted DNA-binding transcriptional regulator AlpA